MTCWVAALKAGDAAAAQPLWERYHRRLVGLARRKLESSRRRGADEEDVVQDAFHSFFKGVAGGRFPRLDDRDNLWRLLVVITARKALDQLAHERSQRRRGGTVRGESRITMGGPPWDDAAVEQAVGDEPTPAFAAQVAEEYRRLLDRLGDDGLRRVAVWKMEGFTNDEIAAKLGRSLRTVPLKPETIRAIWSREPTP